MPVYIWKLYCLKKVRFKGIFQRLFFRPNSYNFKIIVNIYIVSNTSENLIKMFEVTLLYKTYVNKAYKCKSYLKFRTHSNLVSETWEILSDLRLYRISSVFSLCSFLIAVTKIFQFKTLDRQTSSIKIKSGEIKKKNLVTHIKISNEFYFMSDFDLFQNIIFFIISNPCSTNCVFKSNYLIYF